MKLSCYKMWILLPLASNAFTVMPLASNHRASCSRFCPLTLSSTPKKNFSLDNIELPSLDKIELPSLGKIELPSSVSKVFDVGSVGNNVGKIRENLMSGEIGSRGEVYVVGQFAILICILVGTVPFVGDVLHFLAGPGLLLAGVVTLWLSVQDLGESLSPWPVTNKATTLRQDGLYGYVRHPIYAGLLASCAGFSLFTDSATRFLLTLLLWFLLDSKTNAEERDLIKTFPLEYPEYQEKVKNKFVPTQLLEDMPWNRKKSDADSENDSDKNEIQ